MIYKSALAALIFLLTAMPANSKEIVVTEFLEPNDTGLGKSLYSLLRREILTAIRDQSGARVVAARPPDDQRLTDLLEQGYHNAAVRIARYQRGYMILWGAVQEHEKHMYVSSYLTIPPESAPSIPFKRGRYFELGIHTKFNFPLTETTRGQLFARRLVTRKNAVLRAKPDTSAEVVHQLSEGTVIEAEDMEKDWFKIRTSNGSIVYIENEKVNVPPRQVEAQSDKVSLRASPGDDLRSGKTVDLNGIYHVMDMRYSKGKDLWYQLDVGGIRGWVPATLVRPRFSLPVVHFVAGLYQYQAGRYEDARREFMQFTTTSGVDADNLNLATAYQLLGASELLRKPVESADQASLEAFSKAIEATPYAPRAYYLRYVATLSVTHKLDPSLSDLEKAIELSPADPLGLFLVSSFHYGSTRSLAEDADQPQIQRRLSRLSELTTRHASPSMIALVKAKEAATEAVTYGNQGKVDVLVQHAEEALNHIHLVLNVSEKEDLTSTTTTKLVVLKAAQINLEAAIRYGKQGHGDLAVMAAEEAAVNTLRSAVAN